MARPVSRSYESRNLSHLVSRQRVLLQQGPSDAVDLGLYAPPAHEAHCLLPFEQGTQKLQSELERDEEDAVRSRVQVSSEDRALISNWILTLPKERQISEYFAALSAGDERTVAVFEGLPPSVSPLTDAARQTARARKLARVDQGVAASLERTRARLGARMHAKLTARRILGELRGNP